MNRDAFHTYLEKCLGPTLLPGDIVIADNLSSHKGERVAEILQSFGATILYHPPTAPISIPSNWPSPNSTLTSDPPLPDPWTISQKTSVKSSTYFPPTIVPTSYATALTSPPNLKML